MLEGAAFSYLEEGFVLIDKSLNWCKSNGLNLVLDLHKAQGYAFRDDAANNFLFTDDDAQKRFISLWERISKRYKNEGDNLVFELLNEVVVAHNDEWNKLARRAIEAIHAVNPNRYILLGGPKNNSIEGLLDLEIYKNPRIIYNFHFYEPKYVTHQRSYWTSLKYADIEQPYPAPVEGLDILKPIFKRDPSFPAVRKTTVFDMKYLKKCLMPAVKFAKEHKKEIYCGEYGIIDRADHESRKNYIRDVNELFEQYKIGRALWSYKKLDFATTNEMGLPFSKKMLDYLMVKK
jgi:hypothetical protein